ncbi:hypothetical protein H0R90_06090 [Treponema putidum]|uniref:Uncharacterized protein n=1 Tax=Treponema putidum TaxID=221027 RepID=A0AAE9MV47_9SPIR|nr:hypothetical protein [Treponema putidum]AIN94745.1 hypothetical protein JO40_12205 [Treponema putidum]TWI77622.1 hypothetical protein JM98_01316 [Treponema putidum]UTY33638.1 hypothetical protein E4N74_06095 [Treponema putidum]
MENRKNFVEELSVVLETKRNEFNTKILPKVQENYNIQISALHAIRSTLLKKRVIHDDPYKYDSKMTEVEIPSKENFADSEKASVIGTRLAHYETMLDFVNNYYQFNTDFLTPKRISILLELNSTFIWSDFTNTSTHTNTRAIADIINNLFKGPDQLSNSLLRDSVAHMGKSEVYINTQLKSLSFFHREEYKLLMRREIMPSVKVSKADCSNPANILREIKKIFSIKMKKKPFYTDLIVEIIREDYGEDSSILQQEILSKLEIKEKQDSFSPQKVNNRPILISGLKILSNSAPHLKAALEKIKSNQEMVYKAENTVFKKLAQIFRQILKLDPPEKHITIIITDTINQNTKKQTINYSVFEKEVLQKISLFQSILMPNSAVNQKIKTMPDELLFKSLTKYISDSNEILKQLGGLDEFYKNVKPELRSKIRGIKIEITTITNSIIKANQYRAEYQALSDEVNQMKKLGVI